MSLYAKQQSPDANIPGWQSRYYMLLLIATMPVAKSQQKPKIPNDKAQSPWNSFYKEMNRPQCAPH